MPKGTWLHSAGSTALVFLAVAWPWTREAGGAGPAGGAPSTVEKGAVPAGLTDADWAQIRDAYEAGRLAAVASTEGYRARNPGQRWMTRFDGRGFTTTPDGGGWSWGLELVRYGFPGAERAVEGPAEIQAEGSRVAYRWDETLEEFYVNGPSGLEHGYTIAERPPCPEGRNVPLRIALSVRGGLEPEVSEDGRGVRFVDVARNAVVSYAGLQVRDASGASLPARIVERSGSLALDVDEGVARYPLTIDPLAQQAYFKASNTGAGDEFGASVSVSGNTVVVGAPFEDSGATDVSGDQADDSAINAGAAYVFVQTGTTWTQQAYLKTSNTDAGDYFGASVSVSGDTAVVGAVGERSNATGVNGNQVDNSAIDAGAAYVYVRSGTTWTQQAYLKASNTDAGDYFGYSVSVSGDTVIVGAIQEDSGATGVNGNQADNSATLAGAAYVFVRAGTTWTQEAYLKASNADAGDLFGSPVSISANTVVVAARGEDSNATGLNGNQADNSAAYAGAAYVFVRSGTTWTQQTYLKASNTDAFDEFGKSLSLSEDTVVVGATHEDSNATGVNGNQVDNSAIDAGAAYVFTRSGTHWSQDAYLKASNTGAGDLFGVSVSISGNAVIVGASSEDSCATGVNGNQAENSCNGAGAAYVFVRSGSTWTQQAYLKASNTEAGDRFGFSVSLSGDLGVVGAYLESSDAIGVNGTQADNGAFAAGAAYVFFLPPALATFRNAGANPASYVASAPVLGQPWTATVDLSTTGHAFALLFGFDSPTSMTLPGGQVLLCFPLLGLGKVLHLIQPGPLATFNLTVPASPSLCGLSLCTQALHFGAVQPFALSNAYDLTVGTH